MHSESIHQIFYNNSTNLNQKTHSNYRKIQTQINKRKTLINFRTTKKKLYKMWVFSLRYNYKFIIITFFLDNERL